LLFIKQGSPQWDLLGLAGAESLLGVRWKLMNIKKMSPAKHRSMLEKLKEKLA
jgi:hypothetical protein